LLYTAASVGTCKAVELLLENGADVYTEDIIGKTPLYKAVRRGRQDVVETLCYKGANINQHACSGYTPLHVAFRIRFDSINKLLKEGEKSGEGPFHAVGAYKQAVRIDNEIVKLLLSKRAKVDECDFSKDTVLHMAAAEGDAELVELLLNSGANVNLQLMDKRTPLDIAVDGRQQGVVRLLLNRNRPFFGILCKYIKAL
jgi:ankyrin repeat protein